MENAKLAERVQPRPNGFHQRKPFTYGSAIFLGIMRGHYLIVN